MLPRGLDQRHVVEVDVGKLHRQLEMRHLAQREVGGDDVAVEAGLAFRADLAAVHAHQHLELRLGVGERGGLFAGGIGGGGGAGLGKRLGAGGGVGAGERLQAPNFSGRWWRSMNISSRSLYQRFSPTCSPFQ